MTTKTNIRAVCVHYSYSKYKARIIYYAGGGCRGLLAWKKTRDIHIQYTLYTVQNIFFTINKTLYCIVMRTERKITQSFFLNQTTYFWDVSQHYNILDFLELEFLTVYHRTYHKNNEHPYPCILTYLIYYTYIQYLYIFDSVSYLPQAQTSLPMYINIYCIYIYICVNLIRVCIL